MPRRPTLHFVLLAVILQAFTASCTSASPDEVKELPRCGSEFPCIDEIVNLETESLQIPADITGELVALENGPTCARGGTPSAADWTLCVFSSQDKTIVVGHHPDTGLTVRTPGTDTPEFALHNEPGQATLLNAAVTHFEIYLNNKQIGSLSRSIS